MRDFKLGFLLVCAVAVGAAACTGEKGDGGASEAMTEPATDSETASSKPTDAVDSETATEPADTEPAATESDGETDPAATEPGDDTGPADPDLPAGCVCGAKDPCSTPLCDRVEWVDDDYDGEIDDAAAEAFAASSSCALAAMRDGAAGRISWTFSTGSGEYAELGEHSMLGDRTAISSHGGSFDLCYYVVDPVAVGPLKPAQAFVDCLAETDSGKRFDCVREPGGVGAATCQEEEVNCDGV